MTVQTFFKSLPDKLLVLIDIINEEGFKVGFIGGICRDFILFQKIGNDFDCELRPIDPSKLDNQWENLFAILKENYNVSRLSYNVIKLECDDFTVEMTYPRIEVFNGEMGHSNFEAKFIADKDYKEGFVRRDFTVNSILFEKYYDKIKLVDPLGGVIHLNEKKLIVCGKNFINDPVRFLRAIRFKIKLDFNYSYELKHLLLHMPLEGLSNFYVKKELEKSGNAVDMFVEILKFKKDIFPNEDILIKNIKSFLKVSNYISKDFEGLIKSICLTSKIDTIIRKSFLKYFSLSSKKYQILPSYNFTKFKFHQDLNLIIQSEKFNEFCDLVTKLQKLECLKSNDELLRFFIKEFGIKRISLQNFKKIIFEKISLSNDERSLYPKDQYQQILIAKKLCQI